MFTSTIVFITLSRVTLPDDQIENDENVMAQESIKILESRQHQDEATNIKKVVATLTIESTN